MNATITRFTFVLLSAGAFAAGAHAEYRCDPAPTPVDQRACDAAKQGPDALRRFVERWDQQDVEPLLRGLCRRHDGADMGCEERSNCRKASDRRPHVT